ncbi:MAG: hypothetical protein J0L88_12865 [Xanthomonadales bacterium]|nr:hypothetical protein [Xanthomonadales bacterium]
MPPLRLPAFLAIALFACTARIVAAADGDLDPAFGDGHQRLIARTGAEGLVNARIGDVTTLADGRAIWGIEDGVGGVWIERMRRDGQPDPAFAADGRLELQACVADRPLRLVALADRRVVVWAGACLLRLLADGSIDPGFDATDGPPPAFHAAELRVDANGRFVLAGTEAQAWRVYRFQANGAIDPTFAKAGVATIPVTSGSGQRTLATMALDADQRIVLGGWRANTSGTNLVLARLTVDGAADSGFGADGIVDLGAPAGYSGISAHALAIDRDGSLVVAGEASNGMQSCCVLFARFGADGALPPQNLRLFALGANVTLSAFAETSTSIAVLPRGKVLIARNAFPFATTTRTRFTLVRLHADGTPDLSFEGSGWRSYVVNDPAGVGQSGPYTQIHGMAQAEGAALMFGRTFFEDNAIGVDYVSLMRARFDDLFVEGFEH